MKRAELAINLAKLTTNQEIDTTSTNARSVDSQNTISSSQSVADNSEDIRVLSPAESLFDDIPPSSPVSSVISESPNFFSLSTNLAPDEPGNCQPGSPEEEPPILLKNIIDKQINKIQRLFANHGFTWAAQKDTLEIMREISSFTQRVLPKQGSTLMGRPIQHFVDIVPPGKVVYFGIEYLLNLRPGFFNRNAKKIYLTVGIEGLPLFRSSNVGVWPILGRIGHRKVFLIGFYVGIKKPKCSNQFLERFVNEVCLLRTKGVTVKGRTYPFAIRNFIMDAPAKAYILGIKSHNAKAACSKCCCVGVSTSRKGLASTKNQKKIGRKAVCFLNLNAKPRKHEDFFDDSLPRCDPKGGCSLEHLEEEDLEEEKTIDRGIYSDDAMIFSDDEDDDDETFAIETFAIETYEGMKAAPEERHHRHWSILSRIINIDLIKDFPLDPMHLLYIGCCPKWLKIFCDSRSLLSAVAKDMVSVRLLQARQYQPCEFQRSPDILDKIKLWKATQFRVFLLYIGLASLKGLIEDKYFEHLSLLVCSARMMTKKLPSDQEGSLKVRAEVAAVVRGFLHKFVMDAIDLFGPEFIAYNVHNLIHIVDDYVRFGSLEEFSAFVFENFLKELKNYVHAGYKPGEQIVNRYSAHIRMGIYADETTMVNEDRQPLDDVEEYYDEPVLLGKVRQVNIGYEEEEEAEVRQYESFQELRLRNFKLRTDNDGDRFCLI